MRQSISTAVSENSRWRIHNFSIATFSVPDSTIFNSLNEDWNHFRLRFPLHADDMAEVENPRTNCSVQNDELYCESTILSDRSNFSNLKKVHWALNLEEISYFSPDECKTSDSILKKLKIKARSLKNLDICDDLLQKMQEVIERMMDKIFRHSGEFRIQDFNDLKNDWDKLFELYGEWTWNRMLGYDISSAQECFDVSKRSELERFYILDPNQWDVLLKAVQWFNGSFKHTKSYNFITFVFVELLTGLLKII